MISTLTYAAKLRRHKIKGFVLHGVPFYNTNDIERAMGLGWSALRDMHNNLWDYTQRQYAEWDVALGDEAAADDIVSEELTPYGRFITTYTSDHSGWDCNVTHYMDADAMLICMAKYELTQAMQDALQVWVYALLGVTTQDIPRHIKRDIHLYGGVVAVLDQLHSDGVVWKKEAA